MKLNTPIIQSPPPEPSLPPPSSQPGLSPYQKALTLVSSLYGGTITHRSAHRAALVSRIATALQMQSNEDEERHRQARARLRSLANGQAAYKLDCITRYIELCIQQGVARATEVNLSAILAIIGHKFGQDQIDTGHTTRASTGQIGPDDEGDQ